MDYGYIDANVRAVEKRIDQAREAAEYGKDVTVVAAVKYADADEIRHLCGIGVRELGENRVQQLLEHSEALAGESVRWHFIGTLQTNKVKYIIDKVCMIHSVDSYKLAAEIDKQAKKHGVCMDVLVEINSGEEQSKSGVSPSGAEALCCQIEQLDGLRLRGFMTMAPRCTDRCEYLKFFGQTRELAQSIWTETLKKDGEPLLSMGMSESFEEAIACGADIVRIGRSLFVK